MSKLRLTQDLFYAVKDEEKDKKRKKEKKRDRKEKEPKNIVIEDLFDISDSTAEPPKEKKEKLPTLKIKKEWAASYKFITLLSFFLAFCG